MKIYSVLALMTVALIVVGFRTGSFTMSSAAIDGTVNEVAVACDKCANAQSCCDKANASTTESCCQADASTCCKSASTSSATTSSATTSLSADCACGTGTEKCGKCEASGNTTSKSCDKCKGTTAAVSESCCESGSCQSPSSRAMAMVSVPAGNTATPAVQEGTTDTEWTMWGGTPSRNMVSEARNINLEFDLRKGTNVAWTAALGSQTYGNAIVGGGKVVVGTNNGGGYREDKYPAGEDKGVVLCFDEKTGEFQWQLTRDKLTIGRVCDWPLQGICSTPTIEPDVSEEDGFRMWVVTNRGELMCLDMEGMKDGNDGVVQDEIDVSERDADILWSLDMINELGVFPHNLATSSPLIVGDRIYVITSNGVDEAHLELPAPRSPSMICVDKNTGELLWEQNYPEDRILHGQWSSPTLGVVNGQEQIYFPSGDGWLYALNPDDGEIIWKFDMNPKDTKWELGGAGTRNNVIGTAVFQDNSVIIAVGQDPEHGEGVGHLWRIDATKTGDISAELGEIQQPGKPNPDSGVIWHYGGVDDDGSKTGDQGRTVFRRTISTVAISDGLLFAADLSGFVHCVDFKTGKRHWEFDLYSGVWGSPMVVDGKVFLGLEDGKLVVFDCTGEEARVVKKYDTVNYSSVYSTPTIAHRRMFVTDRTRLYAIELDAAPEK